VKIAIGSDHAGYLLKETIKEYLIQSLKIELEDCGCFSMDPVDYPDIAEKVASSILRKTAQKGILICGTGIGMSISANKFPGIRAALCHEPVSAYFSSAHNNANILTMGGRIIGGEVAKAIVKAWLETDFQGGHHKRRIEKIQNQELRNVC
jgi:ribose 5-phosphate isomerase B